MLRSTWPFGLPLVALGLSCTPGVSLTGGTGGSSSSASTGSSMSQTGSTGASMQTSSTTVTSSASTSSGPPVQSLLAYERAYPFDSNVPWNKVELITKLGSEPGVPLTDIVAAVSFQSFPYLAILTSDDNLHVRGANGWTTTPIDTAFPVPQLSCKRDDDCDGDPQTGAFGKCAAVTTDGVRTMGHIPDVGGTCGPGGSGESILLLGPQLATEFSVASSSSAPVFLGQRDYHQDCYPDAYPATTFEVWGFDVAAPSQCGLAGDWFVHYGYMSDGTLRFNRADTPNGQNAGSWTDDDVANPLFAGAPNHPDPKAVVAAYFEQGPALKTGTIVLIAP